MLNGVCHGGAGINGWCSGPNFSGPALYVQLSIDGTPTEYLAVPTTAEDAAHLGIELSRDSRCQQAFEALALLVALRTWSYHWSKSRCVVHVSSDNMSALYTVTKMQPSGPSLMVVAREFALDMADAVYDPQLVSHVPGVANLAADALSRIEGSVCFNLGNGDGVRIRRRASPSGDEAAGLHNAIEG